MIQDILIVGGGLNGCTLALAAAQQGMHVTLIDAQSAEIQSANSFDGRSYALALTSKRVLAALGLWGELADQAQPMLDIKVTDGRVGEGPGPLWMHFDHTEIEEGPMGFLVEDRHLRRALLSAVAKTPNITHRTEETVVSQTVEQGRVTALLASGDTVSARLLVGCDGRRSGVAERAKIKRIAWGYKQSALVCAIAHERPHNGVAHQFFLPAGPLAILPLTGNRSSIVWTEETTRAAEINGLDDATYLDILRPRMGDFLGEIDLAGERYTYPLGLTLAQRFIAERTALVGDSAHGVHPIAGQGLNAGIRDVAALAEVLSDARQRGMDIGLETVLREYETWRRFDATTLAVATDSFNRLFSNDNAILRSLRDLGMGAVNALPGLRRSVIREAAGLSGTLPKLMQG